MFAANSSFLALTTLFPACSEKYTTATVLAGTTFLTIELPETGLGVASCSGERVLVVRKTSGVATLESCETHLHILLPIPRITPNNELHSTPLRLHENRRRNFHLNIPVVLTANQAATTSAMAYESYWRSSKPGVLSDGFSTENFGVSRSVGVRASMSVMVNTLLALRLAMRLAMRLAV